MPYAVIDDLPSPVRRNLPEHAQEIFRSAFNAAFADHSDDLRREEIAHRIAWAAVKRDYVKLGSKWVPRGEAR